MAHINLLPWRAERRKQREREFYGQLGLAFALGLIVVFGWVFWMGQRVDNQNARNAYLKGQIKQVDAKIAQIKDLEKTRSQLLARKEIIEQLQSNRSQMVHLFDEMVKAIPDSTRLTAMTQKGEHLALDGVAESNASVAKYMRQLEASPWMGQADLKKTVNNHDSTRTPYSFGLDMTLSKPTDEEREAARQDDADGSGDEADAETVDAPDAKNVAATGRPAASGSSSSLFDTRVRVENVKDALEAGAKDETRAADAADAHDDASAKAGNKEAEA